tara:strand:+ start:708 stop:1328 length:621 start_codon:yes stop_codon:yes gene_type:complete
MSTKLSSATALHEVRAASAATATGVSKGGPTETVGSTVIANAQAGSDRILYYVKGPADPVVADRGNAIASSGPLYQPESTDVAVTVPEGSGDQTWVYVQNGAVALDRGDLVSLSAAGLYTGVIGSVAGQPVKELAGVAQHNIPALHFGWILVKGIGVALCSTVALGDALSVSGGTAKALDTAANNQIALALEAAAGTLVVSVKLDI